MQNKLTTFLRSQFQEFVSTDLNRVSGGRRFFLRVGRIIYALLGDLVKGHLSLQAMSLVYTTLITLVPLLAISFSVLKGFGIHNQIEPFLLNLLEPLGREAGKITDNIIGFVDNIEVGVLGVVGLAFLVYSVIALMQKIERVFNTIWRVERNRSLAQRFSDYLSILLVWPLFIFISAGLSTTVQNFDVLSYVGLPEYTDQLVALFGVVIPYLIMTLAFTFIFSFMPNTRVNIFPAFVGGLFAAFMWKAMGFLFSALISSSASYVAIYAAFATLILFMIWIYLGWLVVLLGASISFYVQHPQHILMGYSRMTLSNRMREALSLSMMVLLTRSFYNNNNDWDAVKFSHHLNVPVSTVLDVMATLESLDFVTKTIDHNSTYLPAIPLDRMTVAAFLNAVRADGEDGFIAFNPKKFATNIGLVFDGSVTARQAPFNQSLKDFSAVQEKVASSSKKAVKKKEIGRKK